jgi:hypothetical protein
LALVQLAVHEIPDSKNRIVVSSIPLRTTNVVRGIVQLDDGRPIVVAPLETPRTERATTLTEEDFFGGLDQLRPNTSNRLVAFLKDIEDLQIN